ncbi:MAG: hypothetical protein IK128_06445 [Clostridiales bacterium]|nr:hypothetical protein [Clostridiales bacterium]
MTTLAMGFVIASIVLFFVDLSKAKKENRKVKLWIKIMFIISIIAIVAFIIIFVIFIAILLLGFMTYVTYPLWV